VAPLQVKGPPGPTAKAPGVPGPLGPKVAKQCQWIVKGSCMFGDACVYARGPTPPKQATMAKRAQQPKVPEADNQRGAPKEPRLLFAKGKCRFGKKCKCSRDLAADHSRIGSAGPAALVEKMAGIVLSSWPADDDVVVDEWVLDAGAGLDVTGAIADASKIVRRELSAVSTGGGTVKPNASEQRDIQALGETVDAVFLKHSPNALSVGRRCAERGSGLYWFPWHAKPQLFSPGNVPIECHVDANFVPFVVAPRGEKNGGLSQMAAPAVVDDLAPLDPAAPPVSDVAPGDDVRSKGDALGELGRVLGDGPRTERDDQSDIISRESDFVKVEVCPEEEEGYDCVPCERALSAEHLSLHLPKIKGTPFGALVHADWLEMRRCSVAHRKAQRTVMFTDDIT
ncbi:unnamed protein product, partial [Prorocentrum cordatum]